jgi:hypothetical protein
MYVPAHVECHQRKTSSIARKATIQTILCLRR